MPTAKRDTRPGARSARGGDRAWPSALVVALVLVGERAARCPTGSSRTAASCRRTRASRRYLYVGEGMNSSIAVSEDASGVRNFHVAGKVEASSRAAGHAAAAHARPHLGAAVTEPEVGARRRLRRGRHGRIVRDASGHQAHRHLRDRAADSRRSCRRISRRRTTTSRTIRASRSSTTTRGTSSSRPRRSSTSSRPTRSIRG